jgi:hypothetical protein
MRLRSLKTVVSKPFIWVGRQPARRLFFAGSLIAFGSFCAGLAIMTLNGAILFDGYAADGAFQLMNPLRRIAAGEAIGNTFNFFHGIGVPLMHLPFYYLFGQGFFGSEVSRWLVSPLLFITSAFFFYYMFRRRFMYAFSMTAVTLVAGMWVIPFLILPLTSLLGVRSVVPVLLLALVVKQARFRHPVSRKYAWLRWLDLYELLAAVLLALGFICGTEFGVAAILGFIITNTLYRPAAALSFTARLQSSARVFGMMIASMLLLFTLITRGTPLEPLRFALQDIPVDQFWYFGVPPNQFLDKGNVFTVLLHDKRLLIMLAIAAIAVFMVWRVHQLRKHRDDTQAFIYGLLAGAFAMISMLGYYNNSEASALTRMALLVIGATATILYSQWRQPVSFAMETGKKSKVRRRLQVTPQGLLAGAGIGFILLTTVSATIFMYQTADHNHLRAVISKTKNFVLRRDTSLLGSEWRTVDSEVMPIIQSDNYVPIADVNDKTFTHGIDPIARQIVITPGSHSSFIRSGQIVYLNRAGRQIISSATPRGNDQMVVTIQNPGLKLDPQHDGSSSKMIVAEDFKHDNNKLWMLYSGFINQEMGTFNPTKEGYDYIIHALGPERRDQYVGEFKQTKPEYVLTLTRSYFRYEEWVQNAHWDFYSELDQNYEVVKQTSIYNLWKRKDQPWTDKHTQTADWQKLPIDQKNAKIPLPNLDFSKVPDLEALGQQQQQADRDHRRAVGDDVTDPVQVSEDQYDQFKMLEERGERHYKVWRKENSGNETDLLESQNWLKAARSKQNPFDVPYALNGEYHIARPKRQVILIHLKYTLSQPLSMVPLLGKTTRYMVEPNNTYWHTDISLRPYANEITFPLVISEQNKDSYLRLNTYSMLPGNAKLDVSSAEWMPLDTTPENLQALTD